MKSETTAAQLLKTDALAAAAQVTRNASVATRVLDTGKAIKAIAKWQVKHGKSNNESFNKITEAVKELPSVASVLLAKTVADTIQKTVNGKIDGISNHLMEQDKAIESLGKKIRPFDTTRTWIRETAQGIFYLGTFCLSIAAIIELLKWMRIIQ